VVSLNGVTVLPQPGSCSASSDSTTANRIDHLEVEELRLDLILARFPSRLEANTTLVE
jgi:hypothetical protein